MAIIVKMAKWPNGHFGHNGHYRPIWVSKGASGLQERSPGLQNHLKYFLSNKKGKMLTGHIFLGFPL